MLDRKNNLCQIKNQVNTLFTISHFTVLYKSKSLLSLHSHSRDGGDRLHVLVVGHAGLGLADDPALEDRLHVVVIGAALVGTS